MSSTEEKHFLVNSRSCISFLKRKGTLQWFFPQLIICFLVKSSCFSKDQEIYLVINIYLQHSEKKKREIKLNYALIDKNLYYFSRSLSDLCKFKQIAIKIDKQQ